MKLADWRRSKGWSQQRLASELECSLATVARYEGGTRRPEEPALKRIFLLTCGQVTPNDFYSLEDWRKLFPALVEFVQKDAA